MVTFNKNAVDYNATDDKLDKRCKIINYTDLIPSHDSTTDADRVIDVTDLSDVNLLSDSYSASETIDIDVGNYKEVRVLVYFGTGTGSFTVGSTPQNDGTAAASCQYINRTQFGIELLSSGTPAASYTGTTGFKADVSGDRYLRIDLTVATNSIFVYVGGEPKGA